MGDWLKAWPKCVLNTGCETCEQTVYTIEMLIA